jgi:multiple sugar transport system ATP-binding protein
VTEETRELARDRGDASTAETQSEGTTLVGRFGARTRLRKGDTTEVAVDTRNLHFFDPETGLGIYDGKESVG